MHNAAAAHAKNVRIYENSRDQNVRILLSGLKNNKTSAKLSPYIPYSDEFVSHLLLMFDKTTKNGTRRRMWLAVGGGGVGFPQSVSSTRAR